MILALFVSTHSFASIRNFRASANPSLILKNRTFKKNTAITNWEKKTGKHLSRLFEELKKNKISKRHARNTFLKVSRTKLFRSYKGWTEDVLKLSSTENISKITTLCDSDKLGNKKRISHLQSKLYEKLHIHCFEKLFKVINKKHYLKESENRKISSFLNKSFDYISSSAFESILGYFKSARNTSANQKVMSLILNNYIKAKKPIPLNLLEYVTINDQLTNYIQNTGLGTWRNKAVFYQELRYQKKQLSKILDDERDVNYVKSQTFEIINFFSNNFHTLPLDKSYKQLLIIGKMLSNHKYHTLSREVFRLIQKGPNNQFQNEAYFQDLWINITEDQYHLAKTRINTLGLIKKFKNLNPKLKFWIAYIYDQVGDHDYAKNLFNSITEKHPFSYYSVFSIKHQLKDKEFRKIASELEVLDSPNFYQLSFQKGFTRSVKRLKIWSQINDLDLAIIESQNFIDRNNKQLFRSIPRKIKKEDLSEFKVVLASNILNRADHYLTSFKIIYSAINSKTISPRRNVMQALFPKPYIGLIEKSRKKKIDPLVILSLIRQESAFNPRARSHVGARGLMQIMPATARSLSRRIKTKHLYRPKKNIRLGVKYLNGLNNKYEGNLVYTLAAYNAGESRVKRWRKNVFGDRPLLQKIEMIPFKETRNYVKYIFRNLFYYKLIYSGKQKPRNDTDKIFNVNLAKF